MFNKIPYLCGQITLCKNALGLKGFFGTCAAGMAYGALRLGKINRLYDGAADYQGREFADHLLENMNITIDVSPEQLESIPKEGGFIMVSNHPFGGIEGVMLLSAIAKVRPDFKLMANFILSHIPNLKECFFSVNPFEKNPEWKSSVGGIKGAIHHRSHHQERQSAGDSRVLGGSQLEAVLRG